MPSWISTLSCLLETDARAVLVTVAATRGSAPRAAGAHMVVTAAQVQGSVGGGRLEQRAIGIARELLVADAPSPRLERFALGASLGQCCGGVVVLAFERVGPAQREWVGRAATLAAAGRAWGRRIFIDGPHAGAVAVFDRESVGHTCTDPALSAHARDLLAAGEDTALLLFMLGCRSDASRDRADEGATAPGSAAPPAPSAGSRLASLLQEDLAAPRRSDASRDRADEGATAPGSTATPAPGAGSRLASLLQEDLAAPRRSDASRDRADGSATAPGSAAALGTAILLDASPPPALQVVMFGAGHVGRALAELFGRLPLRVRWVDARAQEFPPALAPNVEPHCTDTPTAEVRAAPAGAVFLVLTHSHALDFELVEAILARDDFRFCGLIGSQTKRARFAHRLHARGIEEARIARLRCPVGLPGLPGKEAEVIALAIAAEVMRLRPQAHPPSTPRRPAAGAPATQPTESGHET
ncbi:xanthine dehydrogenase accessory protein XdhC [Thauera aminoaromatica]|uniref:Xanthine dehydrogenase accessory protein XdhC n=2 Tax=Thauera aminoaromatica TaxID=164330 RepID=C4ZM41_THASP|nr:xanthine dehydrogenase accessory protein XdhC [Thauera aminoaromatica]ACK54096.1 xanthine dehydrogenase accessory protein XdhC [Thauera aminoaromatica]MCK6399065.1 xanthine dehydrogenase accessory protein XdhC [Thauera aminoaromatica]